MRTRLGRALLLVEIVVVGGLVAYGFIASLGHVIIGP